jgi:hypothetical protein
VEVAARAAVLLACAGAAGALLVALARPAVSDRSAAAVPPGSRPLPGLVPVALGGFVLLAAGSALTGAGTVDAGPLAPLLQPAGIFLLVLAGWLGAGPEARVARRSGGPAGTPTAALVFLWAGGALALASWVLAAGALAVAVLAGVRVDPRRE